MKKKIKLNLACGKDIRKNFINIDSYQHKNFPLNIKANLSKNIPLKSNYADFVYSSHFLEHLDWLDGENFLREVYRILKKGGKIRLLIPNYEKIFRSYLRNDSNFFSSIEKYLNEIDYPYYKKLVDNPKEVLKKRKKNNPPPKWHFSKKKNHRHNVKLRAKYYKSNIEIVNWFTHQYGEHKTLYDYFSLKKVLSSLGFFKIKKTSYKKNIDIPSILRMKVSLCVEAQK